jgi:hypothetical protein
LNKQQHATQIAKNTLTSLPASWFKTGVQGAFTALLLTKSLEISQCKRI